jgi:chitin synthase
MKQRRRWVLSDIANMLLVFRNVFRLTQNNNSFSIAYILYLAQMFSIVLLSPASTVVIIAGGLDIVYGVPYALVAPMLGVIILTYALVCLVGSMKVQERLSLALTMFLGLVMLLVVIGGAVFVVQDITTGTL